MLLTCALTADWARQTAELNCKLSNQLCSVLAVAWPGGAAAQFSIDPAGVPGRCRRQQQPPHLLRQVVKLQAGPAQPPSQPVCCLHQVIATRSHQQPGGRSLQRVNRVTGTASSLVSRSLFLRQIAACSRASYWPHQQPFIPCDTHQIIPQPSAATQRCRLVVPGDFPEPEPNTVARQAVTLRCCRTVCILHHHW